MVSGDIVMGQWWGHVFGQRIMLTRTWIVEGTPNPGDTTVQSLQHFLDFIKSTGMGTSLTDQIMNTYPTNFELDFIRAQVVAPVRSVLVDQPQPGVVGAWGAVTTTSNLQGAISFRTDFAGRSQVATIKIGPVPDGESVAGLLNAPWKAELQDTADRLVEVITVAAGGYQLYPVIWHAPGNTSNFIRTALAHPETRTMRRRTVGLGI